MPYNESETLRHDRITILFHWLTVLLIACAFASIEMRILFERGTPVRDATKEWHYVIGILILLVTLGRITNRITRPKVAPRAGVLDVIARLVHGLFYAILLILPVMGWITVNAEGHAVTVLGLNLPLLVGPDKEFADWMEGTHSFIGDSLYILIGGHAAFALLHHFAMRDGTLRRMMPGSA